ncbi:hypothetical protein [Pseudomarimonas salicorniae]|uniref:Uncharacterized protein n=1 Tax=Pseudomarimonas salicorniae TaxID=2933270 RepID=A0ABT0GGG7_9GAMM|nr:hypothetical protein [Lysobacter sp. CAU 1642]MCK7593632.1 hypothetical protein [Lysobacter sp. CAU 1642]
MAESPLSPSLRLRMLAEMGYQPLRWRGRALPGAATRAAEAPATQASGRTPAPARHRGGAASDPLWQALLLAAGAAHLDPATLGWEERLEGPAFDFDGPTLRINPIALRRQPQAKRALWKTLRALRRRLASRG